LLTREPLGFFSGLGLLPNADENGGVQMNFNIFEEQTRQRREMDQELFESAFGDLTEILQLQATAATGVTSQETAREAIAEVLRQLGAAVPTVPENLTELNAQMEYMLHPTGIMRRRVELRGRWWKDAVGVMLGSTVTGEIVVLRPGRFSGYECLDIKTRRVSRVSGKIAGQINPEAFVFYRPLPARRLSLSDLIVFMLRSVNGTDFVALLGSGLAVALLGLVLPYINQQIYASVIPAGAVAAIFPVGALLMGAAIAGTIVTVIKEVFLNRISSKLNISVESAAMMRLFALPATFFKDYSAGELGNRLMNINVLCSAISGAVLSTGLTAVFSLIYIPQMISFAAPLVLPGLTIIFFALIFSVVSVLVQLKITRRQMQISAQLSGLVYALITGIQKIKITGGEKRAFAKWAKVYKEEGKLRYAPPLLLRLNMTIAGGISLGGSIFLYFFAMRYGVSVADYIAFITAYGVVSAGVMALASAVSTVATIKPSWEMICPVLETVPEMTTGRKVVTTLSGNIEINNLTFRYDKDGPLILDNLSLKIRSGEYVAVVGKTGCGKSTLLRLLLGFEKAETGAIYYDGQDIEKLDLRSVRQCIGVDLQNGKLFAGDIFANIVITAPWKTLEEAWEAARIAGIEDEIKAMPMGMHTMLSEGSGGISGGQRQRLMIARAIVSKPKILLFDEATSALDNITQKKVADSIAELKCTRLIIAHRLSTIRHCDRIVVLSEGKIVEEGGYADLMEKRGLFYEMSARQTLE
jgi:NHLM bacteriocin system ABC transporter ATP-binding protein